MSTSKPTAYGELIRTLEALPTLVLEKRRRNGLSLRTAAEQIPNVGPNTVFRVEKGHGITLQATIALLQWVSLP